MPHNACSACHPVALLRCAAEAPGCSSLWRPCPLACASCKHVHEMCQWLHGCCHCWQSSIRSTVLHGLQPMARCLQKKEALYYAYSTQEALGRREHKVQLAGGLDRSEPVLPARRVAIGATPALLCGWTLRFLGITASSWARRHCYGRVDASQRRAQDASRCSITADHRKHPSSCHPPGVERVRGSTGAAHRRQDERGSARGSGGERGAQDLPV